MDYSLANLMYHNSVLADLLSCSDGGLRIAQGAWMGIESLRKQACDLTCLWKHLKTRQLRLVGL